MQISINDLGVIILNEQLNILNIIDMLLRRWTLVLFTTILVGVFAFVYSEVFVSPVYSSTAALYVNSEREKTTDDVTASNLNSSRQLVMTYAEILSARTFLTTVAEDLDNAYTATQIKNMISMDSLNNTEILKVTVKGNNAADVYEITKSIVKHAPDELIRVVEAGSVKVLDDASETTVPISPNIRRNTFIGVFIGIVLGAFIVIVLELFDTRIKNGDEISQRYEEPLLGEIPSLTPGGNSSNYASGYGGYGYGYGYGYGDIKGHNSIVDSKKEE